VTIAFLTSLWVPRRPRQHLGLALADQRVDRLDLDLEELLDSTLDFRLRCFVANLKTTWLFSAAMVAFSVITGATIMS
jgi:hypothetical protein